MTDAVNRFYSSISDTQNLSESALVELFLYFLTVDLGQKSATAKEVAQCFEDCDLGTTKNVSARLSEGLKGKPPKYLKSNGDYKLQRHMRETISAKLGAEIITVQTSVTLRRLEQKLPAGVDKDFLKETIDCFEAGANRATIVMAWILTMNHLFEYILAHKLSEFNLALSTNKDKSVKVTSITKRDDFSEMKESKFIDICRQAKIISNDVRKILDQKLDTRNSSAHPSGIKIANTKAIDFVEDLVENVVLKYSI